MNAVISPHDYVLGELSLEDMVEAERLMREDPEFRAEVERLRQVTGPLSRLPAEGWEPIEPPPLAFEPPRARRPRRRAFALRPLVAAAAACALIAMGVAGGLLLGDGGEAERAVETRVALNPVGRAVPAASGTAQFDRGEVRLRLTGLPRSERGRFYEVWLLNSPTDLVSIGGFRVSASGEATFTAPLPVQRERFKFVDLSVEPADGNPRHSGDSVLRGPIS